MEPILSRHILEQALKSAVDEMLGKPDDFAAIAYANYSIDPNQTWPSAIPLDTAIDPTVVVAAPIMASFGALHGTALLWKGAERRTLPHASSGLLRQSILGSAVTHWLFSDPEPRIRLLTCTAYKYKVGALKVLLGRRPAVAPEVIADTQDAIDRHVQAWSTLCEKHASGGTGECKESDTLLWDGLMEHHYAVDNKKMVNAKIAWRMLSADAHGYQWGAEFRNRPRMVAGDDGQSDYFQPVALPTDEYYERLQTAIMVAHKGLELARASGVLLDGK